jgi:hypothetical protein
MHVRPACPSVLFSFPCLSCSLKLYNNLVERCFKDCVLDFRSKTLGKDEEKVSSSKAGMGSNGQCGPLEGCRLQSCFVRWVEGRTGSYAGRHTRIVPACCVKCSSLTPHQRWLRCHCRWLPLPVQCVQKCCEKFMNVSARTGARFQEFFSEMEKQVGS